MLAGVLCASSAQAEPTPIFGVRGGLAQHAHYGARENVDGGGAILAIEPGLRLAPGLALVLAIERGPHLLFAPVSSPRNPVPIHLRDVSFVALVEVERDRFVVGGGAGLVAEIITTVRWEYDFIGPTDPHFENDTAIGAIAVARAAVRVSSDGPPVSIVAQLSAQTIDDERSGRAYGASIGVAVRWP